MSVIADYENEAAVKRFFRIRWPHGFRCPACGGTAYTEIRTRSLPLYQCRSCRKQTSLTAGTIMHKSHTPLAKWLAAIDALSASRGLSAAALGKAVGITTKAAWLMLRKFRAAISRLEEERKLEGHVRFGLRVVAPASIWMFWAHNLYKSERVVAVAASVDALGEPGEMKIRLLDPVTDLIETRWFYREKIATAEARERLIRGMTAGASVEWCKEWMPFPEAMDAAFKRARKWLVDVFNGIGTKYLQSYLNEYCFRWNTAARGESMREAWMKLCFEQSPQQETAL